MPGLRAKRLSSSQTAAITGVAITVREVKNALLDTDIQVYAIGVFDRIESPMTTQEERDGPELLADSAEQSGGRYYPVDNLNDLPPVSAQLGRVPAYSLNTKPGPG